jgi:bacteriocin biosynthesis cyclodehydratase domain-containing protein
MTAARILHPRLALPFTLVPDGDTLHLVAGEDVRYSLRCEEWTNDCAHLLRRCDGRSELPSLLGELPETAHAPVLQLVERLYGERILVDGPVESIHRAQEYQPTVVGSGQLAQQLNGRSGTDRPLYVLCQDSLDYHAALQFNRQRLSAGDGPWLWVSSGPMNRVLVSPVFLPHAGPCLACLWRHFRRLSPTPHLYDGLMRHGAVGGEFAPSELSREALVLVEQIVRWKVENLRLHIAPPACYQLHVLELDTLEISLHRVLVDPTCSDCLERGFPGRA